MFTDRQEIYPWRSEGGEMIAKEREEGTQREESHYRDDGRREGSKKLEEMRSQSRRKSVQGEELRAAFREAEGER